VAGKQNGDTVLGGGVTVEHSGHYTTPRLPV